MITIAKDCLQSTTIYLVEETVDAEMAEPLKNAKPSLGESGVYLTDSSCDDTNIYGSTTTNELLAGVGSETCSVSTSALLAASSHDVHHQSVESIPQHAQSTPEMDRHATSSPATEQTDSSSEKPNSSKDTPLNDSREEVNESSSQDVHETKSDVGRSEADVMSVSGDSLEVDDGGRDVPEDPQSHEFASEEQAASPPHTAAVDIPFVDSANSSDNEEDGMGSTEKYRSTEEGEPVFSTNNTDSALSQSTPKMEDDLSNMDTAPQASKPQETPEDQPTPPNTPMETEAGPPVSPAVIEQLLESWVDEAVKLSSETNPAKPPPVINLVSRKSDGAADKESPNPEADAEVADTPPAVKDTDSKTQDEQVELQPMDDSPAQKQEVSDVIAPATSTSTLESYKPGATPDPKRKGECA